MKKHSGQIINYYKDFEKLHRSENGAFLTPTYSGGNFTIKGEKIIIHNLISPLFARLSIKRS